MKVAIIGTTAYEGMMGDHAAILRHVGHDVRLPCFDLNPDQDELQVCEANRANIEWADEVHVLWDQRSVGTILDFGMCLGLHKKVELIFLQPKTITGMMKMYVDGGCQ